MTFDELINSGYTEFPASPIIHKYSRRRCQKTIRAEDAKLYFVNVYEYNSTWSLALEVEVDFYTKNNKCFTVNFHDGQNLTVEQMEKFFEDVYNKLDCQPNIHNN